MEEFEWSDWFYSEMHQNNPPIVLWRKPLSEVEVRRRWGSEATDWKCANWAQDDTTDYIQKYRYKIPKQQTGYAGADELGESEIALADLPQMEVEKDSPWNGQVGGSHYTDLKIQPLYRTLVNKGYEAFSGACYTKIDKYTTRTKDSELEQLKKARHVLDLWIYEAEQKEKK